MPAKGFYARHIGPIRDFFVIYLTDICSGQTIEALKERLLSEINHIDLTKDKKPDLQKAISGLERECYKRLLIKISNTQSLNDSIEKLIRQIADDVWLDMKEVEHA